MWFPDQGNLQINGWLMSHPGIHPTWFLDERSLLPFLASPWTLETARSVAFSSWKFSAITFATSPEPKIQCRVRQIQFISLKSPHDSRTFTTIKWNHFGELQLSLRVMWLMQLGLLLVEREGEFAKKKSQIDSVTLIPATKYSGKTCGLEVTSWYLLNIIRYTSD